MSDGGCDESHWIVMKYGGSSVATVDAWQTIAHVVTQRVAAGHSVMLVCSAVKSATNMLHEMVHAARTGKETTRHLCRFESLHRQLADELGLCFEDVLGMELKELEQSLKQLTAQPCESDLAPRIMATGEFCSTKLGYGFLQGQLEEVAWLDARDILRVRETDASPHHGLAVECDYQRDNQLIANLSALAPVVMTQGYIAGDVDGTTRLLGRGGSDTSAAYLAAKLGAACLEIWTDVPGVFTANPNWVHDARLIRHLSYQEAESMARLGTKVLHPRSLEPVRKAQILFIFDGPNNPSYKAL